MNANAAALTVAGVIALGFVIAICRTARRIKQETDVKQAKAIAATVPELAPRPAIRDTEPGVRLDWQDECELIYAMPEFQPGTDRLLQAIHDDENGGQP